MSKSVHNEIRLWWGVWEACSAVGVSVPKILLLDIWVCAVATARGEYISSFVCEHGRRALKFNYRSVHASLSNGIFTLVLACALL